MSANHILQNFLSAENFLEWKWALIGVNVSNENKARFFKQLKTLRAATVDQVCKNKRKLVATATRH